MSDVEASSMSSLEKCLCSSLAHFLIMTLPFLTSNLISLKKNFLKNSSVVVLLYSGCAGSSLLCEGFL